MRYNTYEAKAHLCEILDRVERGERVIICRRNKEIAEICPLRPQGKKRRQIGVGRDLVQIADDFDAPLPDEIIESFYSGRLKGE